MLAPLLSMVILSGKPRRLLPTRRLRRRNAKASNNKAEYAEQRRHISDDGGDTRWRGVMGSWAEPWAVDWLALGRRVRQWARTVAQPVDEECHHASRIVGLLVFGRHAQISDGAQ